MADSDNDGCAILGALAAVGAYLAAIGAFFFFVAGWILGAAALVGISIVVFFYARAFFRVLWGTDGWVEAPLPPEPAFRQYFFHKAWKDYFLIVKHAFTPSQEMAEKYHKFVAQHFFNGDAVIFLWAPGVTLYLGLVVSAGAAAVLYVVLGTLHLTLLGSVAGAALIIAALCRLLELAAMKWHRTFHACPHGDCHERFDLAWYSCDNPECGAEHRRLIPGPYGVFFRRCRCERELPTFFLMGRNRLPSVCPCCRRPLDPGLPIMPRLDIPLIGGPSAGKSSFLLAVTTDLQAVAEAHSLSLTFTNEQMARRIDQAQALLSRGERLTKTVALSPDAIQSILDDGNGRRVRLSWIDPAGEIYTESRGDRTQTYFQYCGAAILLLDPFSIQRVRDRYARKLADFSPEQASFCLETPEDVCARAIGGVESLEQNGRKPLAIVITKCDLFDLKSEILATTVGPGAELDKGEPVTVHSPAIRSWLLEQDQVNLIRMLERQFHPVRYFCTQNAAPHGNSGTDGNHTTGASTPLAWIFRRTRMFDAERVFRG